MKVRFRWLLPILMVITLTFNAGVSQAALDAPIDLTNPRIVPIYQTMKGRLLEQLGEASYSGFLYSSRIVFTAGHADFYFSNDGKVMSRDDSDLYVGLPNSRVTDLNRVVKVSKRLVSKLYRSANGDLDDFAIYILENDLVNAQPVDLLSPEIEKELIATGAEVVLHGYGEFNDRCSPGEKLPCSKKLPRSSLPRSLKSSLTTLDAAEKLIGYKLPQFADHLIITNGKTGFGCSGDSGGSITTSYKGKLMYLGPTPNGANVYSCGISTYYDGISGIFYSSPIYKHLDLLKEAEAIVAQQLEVERRAAQEKAEIERVAAEKLAAEKAAAEKAAAEKAAAEKAAMAQLQEKKLKTITCIKGKIVKKVTSINPTCPKGYKKK